MPDIKLYPHDLRFARKCMRIHLEQLTGTARLRGEESAERVKRAFEALRAVKFQSK